MAEPGLYPLTLEVTSQINHVLGFRRTLWLYAGDFLYDRSLPVDPATFDPEIEPGRK